jgi:hypothetical protein
MEESELKEILESEGFKDLGGSCSIRDIDNDDRKYIALINSIKYMLEKGEENIIININKIENSNNYWCKFYRKKA